MLAQPQVLYEYGFSIICWDYFFNSIDELQLFGPYFSDKISISFWVVLTNLCTISLDQYSLGLWAAVIVHIQFLCDFVSLMLSELIL